MNKVIKIMLILMIVLLIPINIYATEEVVKESGNTETVLLDAPEHIYVNAKVIDAGETYEDNSIEYKQVLQKVKIKILEGDYKGREYDVTYTLSYDLQSKIVGYKLNKGNTVYVDIQKQAGEVNSITIQDVIRQNYVIYMVIVFFVLILAIGRKQGLKAILALIVTILAIFFIMITAIFKGVSPIFMSILTSAIIIVITFIIIGGFNKKSFTAAVGTTGGVVSAGVIALIFGMIAKLSGANEEAIMLSVNATNICFNFRELLFAGIVISALGACMDVGMSISSALSEIKEKNPNSTGKELLKSGMNIGRDVIGTMVNTLILAYVGGAMNLILLFMACDMSLVDIINKETIATDAISAMAASMGVVCTIPITAAVFAYMNRNRTIYKKKSDNIIDGKRSLKL